MPKKSDRVFARSGFDEHRGIDDIKIHLVMNIILNLNLKILKKNDLELLVIS